MSGAQVIVAYPRKEGATFDKDYYLSTHMPMVEKHWRKHGLKSYAVTELSADTPYTYMVAMDFESYEGFGAASQDPNTKELMEDVPKFSNEQPIMLHGGIIRRQRL
jgi:uncharacterized protein (TIGR02118 family)